MPRYDILLTRHMPIYNLNKGTIETNQDGEVVGASEAYTHLLGWDISDVIRKRWARGISRDTHEEERLPFVQKEQRNFRRYGKDVL